MGICPVDDEIELRLLEEADADAVAATDGSSHESGQRWIRALREHHASGGDLPCAIRVGGETVGYVVLEVHEGGGGLLHYGLVPAARGRGIATRACAALVDHAFRDLGRELLKIDPYADNLPSCAVAERLGFIRHATVRLDERNASSPEVARYRMTRAEWDGRQRHGTAEGVWDSALALARCHNDGV